MTTAYLLIVDSAIVSLLIAVVVCGLLFAMSVAIDRGSGASHVR